MAIKRWNDPLKMTTERNLRKIKQNTRLKIRNQIKFSNNNPVAFRALDSLQPNHLGTNSLEYDLKNHFKFNLNNRNHSTFSTRGPAFVTNSHSTPYHESESLPEGVEQMIVPNPLISTDREPEQQSIYDQMQTPRDSTIPTDRQMTHRSAAIENQLAQKSINMINLEKNKIGLDKQSQKQSLLDLEKSQSLAMKIQS